MAGSWPCHRCPRGRRPGRAASAAAAPGRRRPGWPCPQPPGSACSLSPPSPPGAPGPSAAPAGEGASRQGQLGKTHHPAPALSLRTPEPRQPLRQGLGRRPPTPQPEADIPLQPVCNKHRIPRGTSAAGAGGGPGLTLGPLGPSQSGQRGGGERVLRMKEPPCSRHLHGIRMTTCTENSPPACRAPSGSQDHTKEGRGCLLPSRVTSEEPGGGSWLEDSRCSRGPGRPHTQHAEKRGEFQPPSQSSRQTTGARRAPRSPRERGKVACPRAHSQL